MSGLYRNGVVWGNRRGMTDATRAQIAALAAVLPEAAVIPDAVLDGALVLPAWALRIVIELEPRDDDHQTAVEYRSCGRCLEPIGMAALVFGHQCAGTPDHLPGWVHAVLWAVA